MFIGLAGSAAAVGFVPTMFEWEVSRFVWNAHVVKYFFQENP